ncbi:Rqc2 family fibronectin-binding protein [Listeria ilorinensis]|uniref:Rqc2 family fibronectin-binding protein n=1 Tax=Listeria ilorinensis TaxID=2867439 RepID=UPI001EF44C29|nr:NFACT RNA binding domain-containing protein [Listeria ilorinensis]
MAFDAMFLTALLPELKNSAESGRIMKIHQPFSHELVLYIRKNRENKRLLISAHPSYARIQWTSDIPENPVQPPMFCMLLRKYLEGAIIEEIEQIPNERVLLFHIRGKDDIGESRRSTLYIEIMGRHSNITLVDQEKQTIVDCIKHISPAQNSYRTLLPGATYLLPPQADKLDPFQTDKSSLLAAIDFSEGQIDKQLVRKFSGFSPLLAKEIVGRAGEVGSLTLPHAFFETLDDVRTYLEKPLPQYLKTDSREDYTFMPLMTHPDAETNSDLSTLLDQFYLGKARRDRVHQLAHDLERLLANERAKNLLKIEKLENTLLESEKADDYRIKGELLTANLYQMEKGLKEITVENFYDEALTRVTIPLDTRKTPSQNAQSYFNRYQKLRNAVHFVEEQITLAKEEIRYIEGIEAQLDTASTEDIEEIRQELGEQGYMRYRQKKGMRKKNSAPKLDKYRSSTGLTILVGKNNKQNDYLTNKWAKNHYLWFHVKDLPGSHVVIESGEPDETSILEAAMIAAHFSKARLSARVPVDATQIKHVKKPNGAKPGYVTYDNQTTYFVTPEEEKVRALRI